MVTSMKTTNSVSISLGKPITAPCLIPVLHASTPNCISEPFMVDGKVYRVTALSFGTPHGVVIVDDVDSIDVRSLGASLGTHPLFPEGASIVFVQKINDETIKASLWQRGVGETAFTCEAVCAAATVSIMLQTIIRSIANVLMGGEAFQVKWDGIGEVNIIGAANLISA